jgi:protein O-GlcNAcase/histone acetyltransferase
MTDTRSGAPIQEDHAFLAGVVEGFYGPPWTMAERIALFDWMSAFRLDTYLYAPKDDVKHRALWREPYTAEEAAALEELVRACGARGVRFVYALSPGLDIRFGLDADRERLHARLEQMLALGCGDVALLFDDIPDRLHPDDVARWGSLAAAQCDVANDMFRRLRARRPGARMLFCPTPYCGRMARAGLGGAGYLDTVGRALSPQIDVCWTGPEIVSREITVAHIRDMRKVLRRKPLVWDNLHANDYDGRRVFCGPYAGRPRALREEVAGILLNPNCELPLNRVALQTFSAFLSGSGPWDERLAYLDAMAAWHRSFGTAGQPITLEDLLLLGDCFYLPYEEGPLAMALAESARALVASDPAAWGEAPAAFQREAGRLRDTCARLSELRDRPLFHALSRRTWELREELDLLLGYVRLKEQHPGALFRSDFHLPGTYRGGLVARLQQLLDPRPDGTFVPDPGAGRVAAGPAAAQKAGP